MNYQLYYAPGSASMGIRVMLEEIGAPYELLQTTIAADEPRPPEQLALNPNGWVPVLVWGDNAMYEAAAITVFLCDCLLYTSPSPRDRQKSRMPSSA